MTVHGQVQGVGFRFRTAREARRIGVTGTAVNLPDGTVEVTAFGSRENVEVLVAWVSGPSSPGRVEDVDVTWLADYDAPPPSFTTG